MISYIQNHIFSFSIQILKFKFISILYLFTAYHKNILASASLEQKKIVANLFFPGVIDQGTNKYNRIVKTCLSFQKGR